MFLERRGYYFINPESETFDFLPKISGHQRASAVCFESGSWEGREQGATSSVEGWEIVSSIVLVWLAAPILYPHPFSCLVIARSAATKQSS